MATYNLGVQVYEHYNASSQEWTYTSNLEKSIEYFVTKDMYNYIDSCFKDKRPFLINEVGGKTTISFETGDGSGNVIVINKAEHFISEFNLKCITQRSYSDGQPTEYYESDIIQWMEPHRFLDFYISIKEEWTVKIPKEELPMLPNRNLAYR